MQINDSVLAISTRKHAYITARQRSAESNAFYLFCLPVSHSVEGEGFLIQGSSPSYHIDPTPPQTIPLAPSSGHVQTCSTLPHCAVHPPPPRRNMFKLVLYDARTVRKREAGIRLKCFLILLSVHKKDQ